MSIRSFAERRARNVRLRRRLPSAFGGRVIWTSPDARLRYLRPGPAAFDIELLQFARHFISPGQAVFDVGANVGEFAVAAAHFVGPRGAVLAVEPDPFLCALLHRTIAERSNDGLRLEALCAAVAENNDFATFQIASRGRAANALAGHGLPAMSGVRCRFIAPVFTIDKLAERWRAPDFIKIDVEGAERRVLEGASRTLQKHRPTILVEVTSMQEKIGDLLARLGYKLFAPTAQGEIIEIAQCAFNTLAVPAEEVSTMKARAEARSAV
jgi:FkbM family methyltransferase